MKTAKTTTANCRIKRGDQVVFIAGKEYNRYDSKGKRQPYRGKVIAVDARAGKVKVEGAMIVKRHVKPMPQMNREGGIKEREAWVDVSNVAIVDPETGKPTKVRYETRDGKKIRIAKSGKEIAESANYLREKKKKVEDEETPAEEEKA